MKWVIILSSVLVFSIVTIAGYAEENISTIEKQMWNELYDPPYKEPTEIKKGSALRQKLFDELRPAISNEAKVQVKFSGHILVFKNWAFFVGTTYDENGKLIKYPPMDNSDTCALWLRTYQGWIVVDYSVGHSDVFWEAWHYQYGAPKKVLGLE